MRRAFTPVNELKPLDVKMMLSEIQIERKRISLGEVLIEGMKYTPTYSYLTDVSIFLCHKNMCVLRIFRRLKVVLKVFM